MAQGTLDVVQDRTGGRSARVREAVLSAARAALLEGGYQELSHLAVARAAGVNPATVHRRWSTRARLTTDALLAVADDVVPVPDTGSLRGDLDAFHRAICAALDDPRVLRLFQAFAGAASDPDDEVRAAILSFWQRRFDNATLMFERAADRGEIEAPDDPTVIIEQFVAPIYFRALVSTQPLDDDLTRASVDRAMAQVAVRSRPPAAEPGRVTKRTKAP